MVIYLAQGVNVCSADANAIQSSLASLKSTAILPFWCRLTQLVLENRP